MKKSDLKLDEYYTINGGYVFNQVNGYDQFIVYFNCPEEHLTELLTDFNPHANFLKTKDRVPYGTILPNFTKLKGTKVRCVKLREPSADGNNTLDEPFFNVVDEFGNPTCHFYVISNGRYLDPLTETFFPVGEKKTARTQRADKLEIDNNNLARRITQLEHGLVALKATFDKNVYTINSLRHYPTDEDALAATLSEVLAVGADVQKIKEILRRTGVTANL